jgi:hypothetical protein
MNIREERGSEIFRKIPGASRRGDADGCLKSRIG